MGTPTQHTWPSVVDLKDFKVSFPKWAQNNLESLCSKISREGVDLLKQMLAYDPAVRITPEEALNHRYFDSVDKTKFAPRDY